MSSFRAQLQARGWAVVTGIGSRDDLLDLASSLGRVTPSSKGEVVRRLIPTQSRLAGAETLSASYATGAFPLHTDTAFWPTPCRYIVMRVHGDTRRYSTVLSFAELFEKAGADLIDAARRSVWLARTPRASMFCSMRFCSMGSSGWRYDAQCMAPANCAATQAQSEIGALLLASKPHRIDWTGNAAAVLCNWDVLHGRGPEPSDEKTRILERIYVR